MCCVHVCCTYNNYANFHIMLICLAVKSKCSKRFDLWFFTWKIENSVCTNEAYDFGFLIIESGVCVNKFPMRNYMQ
jgi:hypothetical protein